MSLTVAEAGKRGGLKLLETRGRNHYVVIGRKGQEAMCQKYPGMASEWGRKGGRPKKLTLGEIVGEKSK
jgi:general stress protein YciG